MPDKYCVNDLIYLMARLRKPETGCPWDIAQDFKSITSSTIEEAYEVVDAIEKADFPHLKEELGDLLFQVVFYSQLGNEQAFFDFSGVVSDLVAKLIRRHPHVFPEGNLRSEFDSENTLSEEEIKASWESIKAQERQDKGELGILDDVPVGLPALIRAKKIQKRAASVGFDWASLPPVIANLRDEIDELEGAISKGNTNDIKDELGDVLFSVVNLSRHLKQDCEQVLRQANSKFEIRFSLVEQLAGRDNKTLSELTEDEYEAYWQKAKSTLG